MKCDCHTKKFYDCGRSDTEHELEVLRGQLATMNTRARVDAVYYERDQALIEALRAALKAYKEAK